MKYLAVSQHGLVKYMICSICDIRSRDDCGIYNTYYTSKRDICRHISRAKGERNDSKYLVCNEYDKCFILYSMYAAHTQ